LDNGSAILSFRDEYPDLCRGIKNKSEAGNSEANLRQRSFSKTKWKRVTSPPVSRTQKNASRTHGHCFKGTVPVSNYANIVITQKTTWFPHSKYSDGRSLAMKTRKHLTIESLCCSIGAKENNLQFHQELAAVIRLLDGTQRRAASSLEILHRSLK
jgi:hypothetical protein